MESKLEQAETQMAILRSTVAASTKIRLQKSTDVDEEKSVADMEFKELEKENKSYKLELTRLEDLCNTLVADAEESASLLQEMDAERRGSPDARCAFSDRILHSRMPLDPTHVCLKHTCV
jgi:hypothetical protein